jgi:hypothetical protein
VQFFAFSDRFLIGPIQFFRTTISTSFAREFLLDHPPLFHQTQHAKLDRGFIGFRLLGQDFDRVGLACHEQEMQEFVLEVFFLLFGRRLFLGLWFLSDSGGCRWFGRLMGGR